MEPTLTKKQEGHGRPEFTDEQYYRWYEEMRPFLRTGCSLYWAIEKAGLQNHQDRIYVKYRMGDWFSVKIDNARGTLGELTNNVCFQIVESANAKLLNGGKLEREEIDIIKLVAEKHRTAQKFFVSRTETAEAKPGDIGKIIEDLKTDYAKFADGINGQSMADNASLQDKGQIGKLDNIPAE